MLIATSLAAFLASACGAAPPPLTSLPPMVVTVSSANDVPSSLVSGVLAEADTIWKGTGFTFEWRNAPLPAWLRVVIGNETGTSRDGSLPLGWIIFDDLTPEPQVYVSYANARRLLEDSPGAAVNTMPRAQRETYLARGMGRALAHELGHYLLASKTHTRKGLMRATWSAAESFAADRAPFAIDLAQFHWLVARLRDEPGGGAPRSPAAGRGSGG